MKFSVRSFILFVIVFQIVLMDLGFSHAQSINLEDSKNVTSIAAKVDTVEYEGKSAIKVETILNDSIPNDSQNGLVLIKDISFDNGTIEIELAGKPIENAPAYAKGFIGIAFRVDNNNPQNHECFYLRPVNAVADFEIFRNRSIQYSSHPDNGWAVLRDKFPGKYETYAKMEPGKWVQMKIVVEGLKAQLFVNDMEKPCLVVDNLMHGQRKGSIALWTEVTTEAYFRNLQITIP